MKRIKSFIKAIYSRSLALGLVLILGHNLAYTKEEPIMPSLEWQKIDLQDRIYQQVKQSLLVILKPEQFVLDVEIVINTPGKPNFLPPATQDEELEKNKNKGKIRYTNPEGKDIPNDYIVFAKLGLEAPLVEDFKPYEEKKEEPLSPYEQLWKYNEALDIFKNLDSVKVSVFISDKLPVKVQESVKVILDSTKINLGEIRPTFEITPIDMQSEEEVQKEVTLSQWEWLAKFSNMIGLILASLTLGIIAWILFNRYKELIENQKPQQSIATAETGNNDDEKDEDDPFKNFPMNQAANDQTNNPYSGLSRFKLFLHNTPIEAGLLVKSWIKSDNHEMANLALNALVQYLETDDLMTIFGLMSMDERNEWKLKLIHKITPEELPTVDSFISNQIIDEIIVPRTIEDPEVYNLILGLKPDSAASFIRDYPELGKILFYVMSVKFISKIIDNFSEKEVDKTLDAGMSFNPKEISQLMNEFKEKLALYQTRIIVNPFIERVIKLIPVISADKESALFRTLLKAGEEDNVKALAIEHFPSEMIHNLPTKLLSEVLSQMSMNKRIELLAICDTNKRQVFLDAFAPTGSSARDMAEIEMERYAENLELQQEVESRKKDIWQDFIKSCRQVIRKNKMYTIEISTLIDQWIINLNKSSFESEEDANRAAS